MLELSNNIFPCIRCEVTRKEAYELFKKMDEVKFKRVVNPGDKLICKLELISPIRRGIIHMKGLCFVGDELASEGKFMAKIIKKNK